MLSQAWQIKESGPGDFDLLQVGGFPVIEAAPGWEDKHPGLLLIQLQHQVRDPHVHVTTEVEPLPRINIIQQVSGRKDDKLQFIKDFECVKYIS